MTMNGM